MIRVFSAELPGDSERVCFRPICFEEAGEKIGLFLRRHPLAAFQSAKQRHVQASRFSNIALRCLLRLAMDSEPFGKTPNCGISGN